MSYYYQIKSDEVLKILKDNMAKREKGLKKALDFGEKEGVEVSSVNDCCYSSIRICITNVRGEHAKFFKNKNGIFTPRLNTKGGKIWAEKIKNLRIELMSPFPAIRKETGYNCDMVYDPLALTVSFPKIVWIGEEFFLIAPKSPKSEESPIRHPLYIPKQRWELEKLIEE